MTLLAKARQNRVIALALRAERAKRQIPRSAAPMPAFRSVRVAANDNAAPRVAA